MRGRRILSIVLSLAACVLPLAAIWLPIYGFLHVAAHFRDYPVGPSDYLRQLWPPALQIFVGSVAFWLVSSRRNPPWWSLAASLAPAYIYRWTAAGVGHDFSHVILNECSSGYYYLVWSIGGTSALCAAIALFLQKQNCAAEKLFAATQVSFSLPEA